MSDEPTRIGVVRALIAARRARDGGGADVGTLDDLCTAAAGALSASGVCVSVMTEEGVRAVAATSDPLSAELAELQYTLGEGPSLEAYASRRPVLVPDLGDGATARWPGYSPSAQEKGVQAAFAFPLQVGAARLGVLDVYRRRAGSLRRESLAQAFTFAEVAVETLLDGHGEIGTPAESSERGDGQTRLLDSSVVLYQAQGMVMVDLGISIGDAMARLRAFAYSCGRPLHDVARDVVERGLHLERDGSTPE